MGESCPQTRNQLAKVFRRRTRACTHKGSHSPANAQGQFSVYTYRDSLVHTRLPSEYFNFPKISLVWLSPQPVSQPAGLLLPACPHDVSAGKIGACNSLQHQPALWGLPALSQGKSQKL